MLRPVFAALCLLSASSPPVDIARQSLSAHSDRMFFWLVVSSAVTGAGVILETPGEFHELNRWWKLKKIGKKVSWRVPITFIGLVVVTAGIIGEGVFEFLSADAETAVRAHDEQVLEDTIVQAGTAKSSADAAEKAALLAKSEADAAKRTADSAKTESGAAKGEAETAEAKANTIRATVAKVDKKAATLDALLSETNRVLLTQTPRAFLIFREWDKIVSRLRSFKGQPFAVKKCGDDFKPFQDEKSDTTIRMSEVLGEPGVGWILRPTGFGGATCGAPGITVHVRADSPPETMKAAVALSEELARFLPPQTRILEPFSLGDDPETKRLLSQQNNVYGLLASEDDLIVVEIGERVEPDTSAKANKH